ncbi:unnamed protein product, partial [Rotaria sp. Silwood2]
ICLPSVSQTTSSAGEWPSVGTNVVKDIHISLNLYWNHSQYNNKRTMINEYIQAVGWGTLNEGGSLPSTLQQVTVQTVDYRASTCNRTMTDWHVQFCAGVSGGGKGNFI